MREGARTQLRILMGEEVVQALYESGHACFHLSVYFSDDAVGFVLRGFWR